MELNQRIISLENELKVVKGEIKKLLVDIREMMNNMENPFYNTKDTESLKETFMTQGNTDGHENNKASSYQRGDETHKLTPGIDETAQPVDTAEQKEKISKISESVDKPRQYEKIKQGEGAQEKILGVSLETGVDIFTLTEFMRWADYALATIGRARLNEVVDLYAVNGHLSEKTSELILKIANLSSKDIVEEGEATMKAHITVVTWLNAILNPDESVRRMAHSIYEEMPWRNTVTEK